MARTELPWKLWGRWVRPTSLAVSLADAVIAAGLLGERQGPGSMLDGTILGALVGVTAAAAAIALWLGFWLDSRGLMQGGLLASCGAWAARGWFAALDQGWHDQSALLSACWVVAAGGAYLLEHTTGGPHVLDHHAGDEPHRAPS